MNFCCEDMEEHVYLVDLNVSFDGGDEDTKVVYYSSKFDEYGIPIHDGENGSATSFITIEYCPWCGKRLPESRRDEWFDTMFKLGYDYPCDQDIPEEFKTSEWYRKPPSP